MLRLGCQALNRRSNSGGSTTVEQPVPPHLPLFLSLPPVPTPSCLPHPVPLPPSFCLQLTALGFLLGFSYVRSRNLLTPILIHGAWNGSVLTILFLLASQGVNIQELIHAN